MDKKGNTILHIVKDAKVVQRLLQLDVDVNWPNERGLTPLMIYSKYAYLNSILIITKDPRCDFDRVDPRGFRSIDIAKDSATVDVLDGKCGLRVPFFKLCVKTNRRDNTV
jgi:ankyrin repeat protein